MQKIEQKNMAAILLGGSIGNVAEWYNFLLYVYLAPIIAELFFPLKNKLMSLVLTFTVFALSFLVRPLGGILLGSIGDVYGRQRALIISLFMMAVPALLMGCLPTFQHWGVASPILLCVLRIFQGLSAGGEHTGSAIYLAEHAPPERRTLWVSIVASSTALGILMSSLISLLIIASFSHAHLLAFGWRLGYWLGALFCFFSIWVRMKMPETPHFEKIKKKSHAPISKLMKNPESLKNLFIVFLLASSWGVFYNILYIWMPTYLTNIQHLSNSQALVINSLYLLLFSLFMLLVGHWGDIVKRKRILMTACVLMFLLAYPLFLLLSSGLLWQVYLAMTAFTLIFGLYLPTAFVSMIEIFNTEIRYTGLSFGFNLGLALFGGTAPLVATELIELTHNNCAPGLYMMLAAALALITLTRIVDKRRQPI